MVDESGVDETGADKTGSYRVCVCVCVCVRVCVCLSVIFLVSYSTPLLRLRGRESII